MLTRYIPFVMVALIAAGCANSPPPLANARESAEAVAAAVLAALAGKDRAALESLALSEAEFRAHVWPELPSARADRNLPFSYVWGDLAQKSRNTLSGTLATHGGVRYELRRVSFAGQTKYPSYIVHRETTLHVRDASGVERPLRVYGSMIELDGAWKVFSYVVD